MKPPNDASSVLKYRLSLKHVNNIFESYKYWVFIFNKSTHIFEMTFYCWNLVRPYTINEYIFHIFSQ